VYTVQCTELEKSKVRHFMMEDINRDKKTAIISWVCYVLWSLLCQQYTHVLNYTQDASVWSLTAAVPSDSIFHTLCTNLLTYLQILEYPYTRAS